MRTHRFLVVILSAAAAGALATPAAATFGGANGRISFDRAAPGRGGPQGNIWSIAPDGSAPALLQGGPRSQSDAAWSPDGRQLVFWMQTGAHDDGTAEIFVMNADGSGLRQVTRLGADAGTPSWTPDGRILFVSSHESRKGFRQRRNGPPPSLWLYVVNADGTDMRLLVRTRRGVGGGECVDPAMAPDGSRIALNCVSFGRRAPANNGIYMTGPDGGAITRVSPNGGPDEFNPGWSPDSKLLAFETGYLNARPGQRRSDIAVMNPDGTGVRTVASTPWFETNPVFSPDGTKLAFTSDRDTKPRTPRGRPPERLNRGLELYTVNLDGTGVTRLTTNRSADIFPDWGRVP